MAVTRERFKQVLLGLLNPDATNSAEAETIAQQINEKVLVVPLVIGTFSAAVNAITTNGSACLMKTDRALKIKKVSLMFGNGANLTSDNTDYKSVILQKNDGAGSAGVNIAIGNTTNSGATASLGGTLVPNASYDLTLTAANATVNANQGLLVNVLSLANGVVLGTNSKLVIRYEEV